MHLNEYFNDSLENTSTYVKSNNIFISIAGVVGFPLFYIIWKYWSPQPYESLTIRLIGMALFFSLTFANYWSARLGNYFKYYTVSILLFIVIFFFFMLIKNEHSEVWTLSTICGVSLVVFLTYEWLIAGLVFVIGVGIAAALAFLTGNGDIVFLRYEHLPIYLFIVIFGPFFNYRKNIILEEKYNMLKAVADTISGDMGISLAKVKTAIEDTTVDIESSRKYTEKDLLASLATKLQQVSEELSKVQHELVKSEKMAALGRAGAQIAHELNTPICTARSAAENVETQTVKMLDKIAILSDKDNPLKTALKQYHKDLTKMMEVLLESLLRAAKLVRDFKEISTDQINIKKKEFKLLEYIEKSLLTIKRKEITFAFIGNEVTLYSDPGLFHQIIENLTTNAQKYAYERGKGHIDIKLEEENDEIKLSFIDYGKGISHEHLPKVFDAFFTTGGGKGGTGLGLNIVYKIVTNQLKGIITCQSEESVGTTFTLTIPKNH